MSHYVGLVLGTICHTEKLFPALGELCSNGFRVQDICAIGTRDAMSQAAAMRNVDSKYNNMRSLLSDTEPFVLHEGAPAVIGSQGTLISSLQNIFYHLPRRDGTRPKSSVFDAIFTRLVENIGNECINLTVATGDYGQITSAAQVLLRYSARSVHTHEFLKSDVAERIL